MRSGQVAAEQMFDLFADDAVYDEPFIEPGNPAVGIEAIRSRLESGWENGPPDLELDVLSIEIEGDRATNRWECRSPVFPAPVRGIDEMTFDDEGRIARLVVRFE